MVRPGIYTEELTKKRRLHALVLGYVQLFISLAGIILGLCVYTAVKNVKAGAFWPHITLLISSVMFLIGCYRKQEGKAWLIAGFAFCGFGVFMAFIGTIVDGVQGTHVKDTEFGQCVFEKKHGILNCQSSAIKLPIIMHPPHKRCEADYPSRSCVCCYLYQKQNCHLLSFSLSTKPTIYEGVKSCEFVHTVYLSMIWASVALCMTNMIVSIVECIFISMYKSSTPVTNGTIFPTQLHGPISTTQAVNRPVIFYGNQVVGYHPYQHENRSLTPVESSLSPPPPYECGENNATANPIGNQIAEAQGGADWHLNNEKPPAYSS